MGRAADDDSNQSVHSSTDPRLWITSAYAPPLLSLPTNGSIFVSVKYYCDPLHRDEPSGPLGFPAVVKRLLEHRRNETGMHPAGAAVDDTLGVSVRSVRP